MKTKRNLSDTLFPPYRIWEDIPFGFWYVGFFAMALSFFNLSINFFSHFAILLGHLTSTLPELPRDPNGLDLLLSGTFSLYYLVSAFLFFILGVAYWNFKVGATKRLKALLVIDIAVFLVYNAFYFSGLYLYANPYLKYKAPIYIVLIAVCLYFVATGASEKAKKIVDKG